MVSYILALITSIAALAFDQYSKYYISNFCEVNNLGIGADVYSGKLINVTYVLNDGAAWSMLENQTWLLLSITIVVMLICIALLLKYGAKNKLMFWAITLILSGGIGNMIDRIFNGGNVRDFIQFAFWKAYPVFNIADCAIVIGAGLLILYFILDMLKESKQKRPIKVEHTPQETSDNGKD